MEEKFKKFVSQKTNGIVNISVLVNTSVPFRVYRKKKNIYIYIISNYKQITSNITKS